ncbi:hypothetical protein IE53DRAFT_134176 [Violaceomyces palustris]|uniref:Uncharacterized protein n=1 Tax=Violaceomyces palustris TaxID=1673888 RepID=A0ACD0P6E4_9BASI|nr:hypothetical protein IE53DRAFT_134176 [Violaceomyces palustris]
MVVAQSLKPSRTRWKLQETERRVRQYKSPVLASAWSSLHSLLPKSPRTHFVEPVKPQRPSVQTRISMPPLRNESRLSFSPDFFSEGEAVDAPQLNLTPGVSRACAPTQLEPATDGTPGAEPQRKRCLVFQESNDVLERAAERAARAAERSIKGKAMPNGADSGPSKGRQHSTSSAGEESASTRSSWRARADSRTSSLATSPCLSTKSATSGPVKRPVESCIYAANVFDTPEKASTFATMAPSPAKLATTPAPRISRKLKFAQSPAEIAERHAKKAPGPPMPSFVKSGRLLSGPAFSHAMSSDDERPAPQAQGGGRNLNVQPETGRRSLSFAPSPETVETRERRSLSQHSRNSKGARKRSVSPAPAALTYQQRVKGMKGGGPILSPAPTSKFHAGKSLPPPRSDSGSGYSEDEEDDSDEGSDGSDSLSWYGPQRVHASDDDDEEEEEEDEEEDEDDEGCNEDVEEEDDDDDDDVDQEANSDEDGIEDNTTAHGHEKALARPCFSRKKPAMHEDSRDDTFPTSFLPDAFEDSAPPSPAATSRAAEGASYFDPSAGADRDRRGSEVWALGALGSSRRPSATESLASPGNPSVALPFTRGRARLPTTFALSDGETVSTGAISPSWRAPSWLHPQSRRQTPVSTPGTPSKFAHVPVHHVSGLTFGLRRPTETDDPSEGGGRSWHPAGTLSSAAGSPTLYGGMLSPGSRRMSRPPSQQRALSNSSGTRCRPSLAQCSTPMVVGATSPPQEGAWDHLKHCLDNPPPLSPADGSRASGASTPGSGLVPHHGPSVAAGRYWSEALAALAHVLSDDPSHPSHEASSHQPCSTGHERSRSVPLERAITDRKEGVAESASSMARDRGGGSPRSDSPLKASVEGTHGAKSQAPRPIRIVSPNPAWDSDWDGAQHRPLHQRRKAKRRAGVF